MKTNFHWDDDGKISLSKLSQETSKPQTEQKIPEYKKSPAYKRKKIFEKSEQSQCYTYSIVQTHLPKTIPAFSQVQTYHKPQNIEQTVKEHSNQPQQLPTFLPVQQQSPKPEKKRNKIHNEKANAIKIQSPPSKIFKTQQKISENQIKQNEEQHFKQFIEKKKESFVNEQNQREKRVQKLENYNKSLHELIKSQKESEISKKIESIERQKRQITAELNNRSFHDQSSDFYSKETVSINGFNIKENPLSESLSPFQILTGINSEKPKSKSQILSPFQLQETIPF